MANPSSSQSLQFPYATHLTVMFEPLEKISRDPLVAAVTDGRWRHARSS